MKQKFKFLLTFTIFGLLSVNSLFAQGTGDFPQAYATSEGVITFDANVPLSGVYEFDFTDLNYSHADAKSVSDHLQEITIALNTQLDFSNQKIIIMIDFTDPAVEGWDVNAWNNHLLEAQK